MLIEQNVPVLQPLPIFRDLNLDFASKDNFAFKDSKKLWLYRLYK